MEGKGSFFILLFIVAFLSLTLAGLAGYVFFFSGSTQSASEAVHHQAKVVRPPDEDLAVKKLFEEKGKYFNLAPSETDDKKLSVIQVGVELVYFKKVKGVKEPAAKIAAYDGEIREIVGTYFQNKTLEDVRKPETKQKAKEEITKEINKLLGEKENIIYTINFGEWFYQ